MSFCQYTNEKTLIDSIKINNIFVTDYMPTAPDNSIKVYLLGLFFCNNPAHPNNELLKFSEYLSMSNEDVLAHFMYWQEMGLVKVINIDPIEIRYLHIKKASSSKPVQSKYSEFCYCIQELIPERMVSTNEFYEYINFLDSMHMQPDALLQLIQFCVKLKGGDVSYSYILTVAKTFAYKGLLSLQAVEEELKNKYSDNENLKELLKLFNIKRTPNFEERDIWSNISSELNFDLNVIFYVAKQIKQKNKYSLSLLQTKLQKYYAMQLFNAEDIENFESKRNDYYKLAKGITANLGVYYENLEPVIENYLNKWCNWGYSSDMLTNIAKYCFKNSVRTLEGMDTKLTKFYKLGIITDESLSEYITDITQIDKSIKEILEKLGTTRSVNVFDRDMYKVWTRNFNVNKDVLEYAISKSIGKVQPMQYLNKILCHYNDANIKTLDQAKSDNSHFETATKNKVTNHTYTNEEINSLFQNLDDVEV